MNWVFIGGVALFSTQGGGGGYTFVDIQENFRFEEKGKLPINSESVNMLKNLPSDHLISSSSVG